MKMYFIVLKKSGTSPLHTSTTGDLCHKMKAHMNMSCKHFEGCCSTIT